jgi:hypothetical protein
MARFTVGGTQFELTSEDLERRLLTVVPEAIRELYVEVNGNRYPVKQALAEAAGLQRGMFTSHDAMRVLRRLNFPIGPDELTAVERFYTALKSLNEFDRLEVQGVVAGALAKSQRETCIWQIYLRGRANVQSLLSLRQAMDFQAIIMVTRNLFELAVDAKLIDVTHNAIEKIDAFAQVEKLRAAEKTVAYKKNNPASKVDATVQATFITNNKAAIDGKRNALWPGITSPRHWSGLNLKERTSMLGNPFAETYEIKYQQMSWYTHGAGLTGFDLTAKSYSLLAGVHFELACMCYMALLASVIEEFKLAAVDEKIRNRMRFAHIMPFTDTDEELQALGQELL